MQNFPAHRDLHFSPESIPDITVEKEEK